MLVHWVQYIITPGKHSEDTCFEQMLPNKQIDLILPEKENKGSNTPQSE